MDAKVADIFITDEYSEGIAASVWGVETERSWTEFSLGISARGSVTALLSRVFLGSLPSTPGTRGVVGLDPTRFAC